MPSECMLHPMVYAVNYTNTNTAQYDTGLMMMALVICFCKFCYSGMKGIPPPCPLKLQVQMADAPCALQCIQDSHWWYGGREGQGEIWGRIGQGFGWTGVRRGGFWLDQCMVRCYAPFSAQTHSLTLLGFTPAGMDLRGCIGGQAANREIM